MSYERILIRKTRLLRKIEPTALRSSTADKDRFTTRTSHDGQAPKTVWRYAQGFAAIRKTEFCEKLSGDPARIDLLFTMSEITQADVLVKTFRMRSDVSRTIVNARSWLTPASGGGRRDRTDDLMLAKHALSQLSYAPVPEDECSKPANRDA